MGRRGNLFYGSSVNKAALIHKYLHIHTFAMGVSNVSGAHPIVNVCGPTLIVVTRRPFVWDSGPVVTYPSHPVTSSLIFEGRSAPW